MYSTFALKVDTGTIPVTSNVISAPKAYVVDLDALS